MKRIAIICWFLIFLSFAAHASNITGQRETADVYSNMDINAEQVIFDCAANSFYLICHLNNNSISYQNCLDALPIKEKGNSMLEFKESLEKEGFFVKSLMIDTSEIEKIQIPVIAWLCPPEDVIVSEKMRNIGHYIVLNPLDENKIQFLNYPETPVIFQTQQLSSLLIKAGIEKFPILLCTKQERPLESIFYKPSDLEKNTESMKSDGQKKWKMSDFVEMEKIATWDFSELSEGSYVRKTFHFYNDLEENIEVINIIKNCSCANLKTDKTIIKPKDYLIVRSSLSLAGRIGTQNDINGMIELKKGEKVFSIPLSLTGESKPRWEISPSKLDFGKVDIQSKKQIQVATTEFGLNSRISHVETGSMLFDAALMNSPDVNDLPVICVTTNPDQITGKVQDYVKIYAQGQKEVALYYPITAYFHSDIEVKPSTLLIIPSRSPMGKINIINNTTGNINVDSIEITGDSKGFKVESEKINNNKDVTLYVNILDENKLKRKGEINIQIVCEGSNKIFKRSVPFISL